MSGCTNCKGKAGCDDQKGDMFADLNAALDTLYPTKTWGDWVREAVSGPLDSDSLHGLANELAQELNAAVFVQQNPPSDALEAPHCDFIYILCMGRAPCILQVRDHGVEVPDEWRSADRIDELYLRVVISQRARVAAVQQVAVSATREPDGSFTIREAPRAGVYDAPLLARMQKLVAILPAYDVMHVDFGEIAHAPPGFHAGSWAELYGGAPSIANYLFYPQPTTMTSTVSL